MDPLAPNTGCPINMLTGANPQVTADYNVCSPSTKIMKTLRVSCKVIGTTAPYEGLVALHYDTVCFLKTAKECGIIH